MASSDAGSGGNATGMPDFQLPPGPLPTGDRGPAINAVQWLMIILASSAVIMRFTARRMSAAGIWWDDWMILATLITSLGMYFLNLVAVQTGLGQHIWNVKDHGQNYLRSLFALEVLYPTALALNKLGVLLMYQRLFGIERKLTIAVKVVAAIVIAWWIGVEVATLLQCQPIDKFWNYQKEGHCLNIIALFEGSAIPNVIIDVIILLLPQPILWKLRMSMSNKIALCGIFLLGAL
ncbi:hypothetical protein PRZ48_004935 [Zasmidium cellare]|uniref:Rhodopsin domain-containing protein n=1 Tax=Zasmidium cellare TaxID=395010 RepID=A0ABR0ERB0_ZASCE|nr:hypothetical protein PRZ48_004935 [Zasmidium cellare]